MFPATGATSRIVVDGQSLHLLEQRPEDLLTAFTAQLEDLPLSVARQAESYDLAGLFSDDGPHPYTAASRAIDHLIGELKHTRAELQSLAGHAHCWDPDTDYCTICGADGRA